jgi:hypothetical protein
MESVNVFFIAFCWIKTESVNVFFIVFYILLGVGLGLGPLNAACLAKKQQIQIA